MGNIIKILMSVIMVASSNVSADYRDTDRIEFGFVLLPDESQLDQLRKMRDQIMTHFGDVPSESSHPTYGDYINKPVTIPHVSIGQYGLLESELPKLIKIVEEVALVTQKLTEPMARELSFTDENVFFDCAHIRKHTNPIITETYL